MSKELDYIQHIPMITFDTSGLTGSFGILNAAGFPEAIKLLVVYNGGSNAFTFSLDGVEEGQFFPPEATFTFDIQSNHATNSAYSSGTKVARKGQFVYGKGSAGTGNIYISGYY